MWAAQGGFTAIVRLLLAKNANANATNYEGDTALKMAQNNNHSEIVALLSDRTAGPRVHHGFDAVRVASPASNQELHQNRQEPVIAPQSPDDVTMQFTDLLTMCGQMEEACTMCENVLERLQRMQIQANEQPEIVPPNAQADLASIRARFHHFLVKYKQRNPFERLVSTRMVISLLKEFHERLDAVVAEVSEGDNNLSKWMESWDRDTQEVEASLVRLWKTNPMRILDSLPSQKSQEDALVLLGSETTRKRDSYTADSKTMLRSVKQSIIRLSGASVQAVPDWFLAEYEVQREEQHFALGSFGKVYHGTWYREKVVVKCVNAVTEDEMRAFKREARLWFRAQHPNVVRLFGACHVSQPCFFVCEEAKNGNLVDFLNKSKHVDQALTWRLLHGAALGLQFLHGKKIVHGDLKCNQILVTEEKTAKLTDFGFSFALMESKPNTSTGAVRWKAPELLRSESSAPTFESDLYSFGMCVVEAVSRNVPWGSHLPDQSVIYNLNHRIFISRPKAFVSDEQWEFVCELCAFDPSKRLGLCDAIVQLSRFAEEELESHAETTV
ncbi:TKL protein kinase [Phytophthora cinnamomi]|uniref:TKL protein kinase n=1 Tax=Phytophthora cinnamomi TaxID=4785 RepID=UPI00355A4264|nr:TKL protein kinase [Phytophthora cinnamomi]